MFELLAANPPAHAQTPLHRDGAGGFVFSASVLQDESSGPVDQPTTSVSPSALVFTGTTSPSVISPASNALASWSPMDC